MRMVNQPPVRHVLGVRHPRTRQAPFNIPFFFVFFKRLLFFRNRPLAICCLGMLTPRLKLKQRKLVNATGITGAEGIDCDDWMLVDCDNFIVHFMTAEARQELDLETHWATIASGTALGAKRQRGEEGHVEDPVDWNEDFGEQAALAAGRGVEKP